MSEQDNRDNLDEFEHDILGDSQKSHKGGIITGIILIIALLGGGYYLYPTFVEQLPTSPDSKVEEHVTLPQHTGEEKSDKANFPKAYHSKPDVKTEHPVIQILNRTKKDEVIATIKRKTGALNHATSQYRVQVGTYLHKSSLLRGKEILSSLGLEGYGQRWTVTLPQYRVMIGKYHNAAEPREIVKKMCNDDIDARFEILGNNLYSISVGNFYVKKEALKLKNELILKGYSARLTALNKRHRVHVLRLKGHTSKKDALKRIDSLKTKGIDAVLIKE